MIKNKNVQMFEKKKPFFLLRKKLNFFLKAIVIIALIFILHQLVMFIKLTKDVKKDWKPNLILGTHAHQKQFYTPHDNNKFICIVSLEEIDFNQVNDDYCDCQDGSDEPGTNACSNGQFFCSSQINYKNHPRLVSSSKVNDGICDCCDGSDEWLQKELPFRLSDKVQHLLQHYHSPCPNLCS
ncbi:hypothetical protein ILUMI_13314 [Ignelater luminosus]|uniref:Glucosidase II beta subunit N-terminal domain-containing protein n=1 Tax=Ignelater luminosus TaxID=2038154 RepID=A0A8K0CY06_IGNLU|nr:hypothetical protein ILUMI_13314 [Ignelater luminosus]